MDKQMKLASAKHSAKSSFHSFEDGKLEVVVDDVEVEEPLNIVEPKLLNKSERKEQRMIAIKVKKPELAAMSMENLAEYMKAKRREKRKEKQRSLLM